MFLIIGHGLAGALLADALLRRGHDVCVVDAEPTDGVSKASAIASGILNPVTGKRLTRAWNLETFLPAALRTYRTLEQEFSTPLVQEISALWLHASAEGAALFAARAEADPDLLDDAINPRPFETFFHLREAPGRIHPVYGVDVLHTLSLLRNRLKNSGLLIEEPYDVARLVVGEHGLTYADQPYSHLIFCEGAAAVNNPYFKNLPWSPATGEALILSIPHLPRSAVYKLGHSLSLSPWPAPNSLNGEYNARAVSPDKVPAGTPPSGGAGGGFWWLGSNYLWDTLKPAPTAAFRAHAEGQLRSWLKLPYEISDHRAGVRPATVDRKPFIGFHPAYPRIGILNGLGAKGVLMAPHLAESLAAHLAGGTPLMPEADVARHRRALLRG